MSLHVSSIDNTAYHEGLRLEVAIRRRILSNKPPLLRLADKELLTIISTFSVKDVLALRAVCRRLFFLTLQPSVWWDYVVRMQLRTPPMNISKNPNAFEPENLVRRARSFSSNWQKEVGEVTIFHTKMIPSSGKVLELKVLPGSQYAIGALDGVAGSSDYRYAVVVFSLDRPTSLGKYNFACIHCPCRPYHLQAKYMRYNGDEVIMITYLQEWWDGNIGHTVPPGNEFENHDGNRLTGYQIHCIALPLNQMQWAYAKVRHRPNRSPFSSVYDTRSLRQIDCPTLCEDLNMNPILAFVLKPNDIVLVNCSSSEIIKITCMPRCSDVAISCYIDCFRILPTQDELLVVHKIITADANMVSVVNSNIVIGLYSLKGIRPGATAIVTPFAERSIIARGPPPTARRVHLYEVVMSEPLDTHDIHFKSPPMAISIFVCDPVGHIATHWVLRPSRLWSTDDGYLYHRYALSDLVALSEHVMPSNSHILAGDNKALGYAVSATNHLDGIGRFTYPQLQRTEQWGIYNKDEAMPCMQKGKGRTHELMCCRWEAFSEFENVEFEAIAWDETVGRVCVAVKGRLLMLLDYGETRQISYDNM